MKKLFSTIARADGRIRSWRRRHLFPAVLPLAVFMGVTVNASASAGDAFAPYRIILDRKPFGEEPAPPPAPPAPPPAPIRPEESFARDLRLTFIVRSASGGIRVGIVNERSKHNYFMQIGDKEDGIELINIDYEQERVLLRHQDEEVWLAMAGRAMESVRTGQTTPVRTPPGTVSRYRRPVPASPRLGLTQEEYDRTRSERPAPRPPRTVLAEANRDESRPEIPADLTPEEREQYLREYNMNLIRARGEKGPVLPIQLTEEEDAQLVMEGALPPHD